MEKSVKVDPSANQLNKGAEAFNKACSMGGFSAKEKREICEAIYRAMVGKPQA
jgi:hypothetical protein